MDVYVDFPVHKNIIDIKEYVYEDTIPNTISLFLLIKFHRWKVFEF